MVVVSQAVLNTVAKLMTCCFKTIAFICDINFGVLPTTKHIIFIGSSTNGKRLLLVEILSYAKCKHCK